VQQGRYGLTRSSLFWFIYLNPFTGTFLARAMRVYFQRNRRVQKSRPRVRASLASAADLELNASAGTSSMQLTKPDPFCSMSDRYPPLENK
jgi:hypothetical protein